MSNRPAKLTRKEEGEQSSRHKLSRRVLKERQQQAQGQEKLTSRQQPQGQE
ncbi:conserved hypothetical protein [Ricinus communis]|uniref:Uncharacterized protein n=1 Tax=Ricinus communis TaxID=3988 RepID=B9RPX9_RICCO|nr:conserved hypothetical protein [Ricinus communis]